jgi:hypothetical protein
MNDTISSQVSRYAAIFGPIGAFGGFISDVLQPLAPFSWYVFIMSLVALVLLSTGIFILREWRRRLTPLIVLFAAFLIFSGGLLLLHTKETEAKGVLAAKIPAIEGLQTSLGIIQKDIAEIKETTRQTAEGVARIEINSQKTAEATGNIAKSADKIAGSLDAIQQGFANLSKSGGIIENASKAEEHYHNARLYEQRGDYINARRSYNAFFAFKLEVLDPHLRYQTFLTVQEGRAGSREVYGAMYEQDKRPLIEYARILLFDAPQRTEMLKTFAAAHADFAPVYYELSREYSAARKGTQSLGDKQAELQALETFQKLHSEGKFLKYFIDKELAASWLDDAATRAKALAVLKQAGSNPVTMSVMRSNTDWMVTLGMAEIPREVFYKLSSEDTFRSLGLTDATNPATGLKMPNMYFSLKSSTPKTSIQVKYTDIGNEMRGPFTLEFDPDKALVDAQRKILDLTKNGWISFRDFDGQLLVYFTPLLSSRCALKQVTYGVNSTATPSTFELPACNPKDPYSIGDGKVYVTVPGNSQYVTVQLTYADGSKSEAVRFDR